MRSARVIRAEDIESERAFPIAPNNLAKTEAAEARAAPRRFSTSPGCGTVIIHLNDQKKLLWTGYLCVRRSGELLSLRRSQINDEIGISWTANKGQGNRISLKGTIVWSSTLRNIINEALTFKRNVDAPDDLVFGNLAGQRYTKGGWKKTLSYLMSACDDAAKSEGRMFEPFNLRDCRPAGVTEKLNKNDTDVMEATLHSSERTLRTYYDRRKDRVATPTK